MANSPRFDVSTLGEALLRLSVPAGERLEDTGCLQVSPAGSEANMVAALSQLGRRCSWMGALPTSPLGRLVAKRLLSSGVDLSGVIWEKQGRIGVYYVELARPPRPTVGIYDRAESCASRMSEDEVDWDHLLDTRLIHLTGITPALSPTCRQLVLKLVRRAKESHIPVSFDVNYRQGLWPPGEARTVLVPLIEEADLLLCSREDAVRLLGCGGDGEEILSQLSGMTGADLTVLSLESEGMLARHQGEILRQAAFPVEIIDPIGAGDAMAAGVIHGWLSHDLELGLRMGALLAALALSQKGDMISTSPEEVAALLAGGQDGVRR